jgi:hypothetical protein
MIPDACEDNHRQELITMLKDPKYMECMMVKQPLVPLQKNHRTQTLFFVIYTFIMFTQICIIIPSKFLLPYLERLKGDNIPLRTSWPEPSPSNKFPHSLFERSWLSETRTRFLGIAPESACL